MTCASSRETSGGRHRRAPQNDRPPAWSTEEFDHRAAPRSSASRTTTRPAVAGAQGELARNPTLAMPEGKPVDEAQRNFTDPDSSIMKGADGFIEARSGSKRTHLTCPGLDGQSNWLISKG